MLAEAVIDPAASWAGALTALAITGGLACQIVLQIMARAAAAKTAKEAATQATAVKTTLAETTAAADAKMDDLAKVAGATHLLVNSAMAAQLKLTATVTRRLANLTKDPADEEAADLAEKLSRQHEMKQAAIDAM